jgi:maltose alpha-D-glucosyltransferase/alpha-amylase
MCEMIAVRKEHPAFGRGTCDFLEASNNAVLAYLRRHADETILVVNNLSAESQAAALDLSAFAGVQPRTLLAQDRPSPVTSSLYQLALDRYEYRWLVL